MKLPKQSDEVLEVVDSMIKDGFLLKEDLIHYLQINREIIIPEKARLEMEQWYKNIGIEALTKKPFHLKSPYFTEEEIQEATAKDEILLCLPRDIDAQTLGKLFHLENWATDNTLISSLTEHDDFWFTTKKSFIPDYIDKTGTEITRVNKDLGNLNMSLERYMVFLARMRHLAGRYPDTNHKIWLPNTRYEEKAMLIAGIDSNGDFCTQAWMPNFHSPLVGGRYVYIVDHH